MVKILAIILRIVLGGLFVFAGVMKVLDPERFQADIHSYRLTSISIDAVIALYLPWLEILCGASVVFGRMVMPALSILIVLMLVFIGVNSWAWFKGLDNVCGCFGSLAEVSHPMMLLRNATILTGLIVLTFLPRTLNPEPQTL